VTEVSPRIRASPEIYKIVITLYALLRNKMFTVLFILTSVKIWIFTAVKISIFTTVKYKVIKMQLSL